MRLSRQIPLLRKRSMACAHCAIQSTTARKPLRNRFAKCSTKWNAPERGNGEPALHTYCVLRNNQGNFRVEVGMAAPWTGHPEGLNRTSLPLIYATAGALGIETGDRRSNEI